jgi:hypothetical protein
MGVLFAKLCRRKGGVNDDRMSMPFALPQLLLRRMLNCSPPACR